MKPWDSLKLESHRAAVAALKSLALGTADEDQQIRALKFIIDEICLTYDMSYRPDSERDTAFAEGKRYVGNAILRAIKANMTVKTNQRRKHANS